MTVVIFHDKCKFEILKITDLRNIFPLHEPKLMKGSNLLVYMDVDESIIAARLGESSPGCKLADKCHWYKWK